MTTEGLHRDATRAGHIDPSIVLTNVADALRGLKFGQVTITVHDGAVVQIERIERTRLQRRGE